MGNEIIYNPIFNWRLSKDVDILSIRNVDYLTRIDFIHFASIDWGSINIEENIFIRPSGTDLHLFLVKAENIPIAPKVHYYEALEDYLCFTLYFPALPIGTKEIDIIESELPGNIWFNFFKVEVETISKVGIICNN